MKDNPILVSNEEELRALKTREHFKFYCKNCGKEVVMKYCGLHFMDRYKNFLCRKCSFNINYDMETAVSKRKDNWSNKSDEELAIITQNKKTSWYNKTDDEKEEIKRKIQNTWNNKSSDEIAETIAKTKATKKERYGDENWNNIDKQKETNLEKYGVEVSTKSNFVKEKSKETFRERYGVNSVGELLAIEEYKNKAKNTKLELYGDENYSNHKQAAETLRNKSSEEKARILSERKSTLKERYGDENYNNHELAVQTYFERTRYYNSSQNPEVIALRRKTNVKNHGIANWNNIDKQKETNLEKYGVEYNVLSPNFQEKARQTRFEKTGYYYGMQNPEVREKADKTKLDKYGTLSLNFKGYYYGRYFHSLWELAVWIYCIDNNVPIIREPCIFEYTGPNGEIHKYIPDFLIDGKLIEIKGSQFFNSDGSMRFPYTKLHHDSKELVYEEKLYYDDLYERKHQCGIKHGVEFWRKKDIKPYIDYCNKKYPGWNNIYRKDNFYNPSYWCFNLIPNGMIQLQYYLPISQQGINPYDINKDKKYHFVKDKGLTPFDIK